MSPILKALIAVAVIAIAVVIFKTQRDAATSAGWISYGTAEAQGYSLESLENARDQARGSPAEPWLDFQLAAKLYEIGGRSNLDRAQQVSQDALRRFPEHPASEWFQRIIDSAESLSGVAGES